MCSNLIRYEYVNLYDELNDGSTPVPKPLFRRPHGIIYHPLLIDNPIQQCQATVLKHTNYIY